MRRRTTGLVDDLDVVHAEPLDVLDVPPADVRQHVGGRGDAERVHTELEAARIVCVVLSLPPLTGTMQS